MSNAIPRAATADLSNVLNLMDALLDNKDSLLKRYDSLCKALRVLLNPTSDAGLAVVIAQLLRAHPRLADGIWDGNLADLVATPASTSPLLRGLAVA